MPNPGHPKRSPPLVAGRDEMPTASEIIAAIAAGETTPTCVLENQIALIDELECDVQAWVSIDREGARARARELDRISGTSSAGLMNGVPFGLKDNIDTVDMPTGYGSEIYEDNQPSRDAACVASLRLAGANPLGKTVSAEFAHRTPGATRNPWNLAHTPGGSSSGSAAAVACAMVPIALGTQTTGSVIRPAAYCGVIGYKPTYGEFNLTGVLSNSPSFDTLGVMARCVEDLVLVRRALLDSSVPPLSPVPLTETRIGICRTPYWERADGATRAMMANVMSELERGGAKLIEFDDAGAFHCLEQANVDVSGYEFARSLAHERRTAYNRLSTGLREGRMADGLHSDYATYVGALDRIERNRLQLDDAFANVDFVITPSATSAAPMGLHATGSPEFNMAWTTLHAPAITLPVGNDGKGMPLGVQLVGKRHSDDRLLAFASSVLERFTPPKRTHSIAL